MAVLPTEIKHLICTFCSRTELANLAQVNQSYLAIAETVLYRTLVLGTQDRRADIVDALLVSDIRRDLVRSLTVRHLDFATDMLYKILPLLPNLQHLCLYFTETRSDYDENDQRFSEILCGNYFRLYTLHCNLHFPNLPAIVLAQSLTLRCLGLFLTQTPSRIDLQIVTSIQESAPNLQMYGFMNNNANVDLLAVFPFKPDHFSWNPILHSFLGMINTIHGAKANKTWNMQIYVRDMTALSVIFGRKPQSLPDISRLSFRIESTPGKLLQDIQFASCLAHFPGVKSFSLELWTEGTARDYPLSPLERLRQTARDLSAFCPELYKVRILGRTFWFSTNKSRK